VRFGNVRQLFLHFSAGHKLKLLLLLIEPISRVARAWRRQSVTWPMLIPSCMVEVLRRMDIVYRHSFAYCVVDIQRISIITREGT